MIWANEGGLDGKKEVYAGRNHTGLRMASGFPTEEEVTEAKRLGKQVPGVKVIKRTK